MKTPLIFTLLSLAAFLHGCRTECPDDVTTYYIQDYEKDKVTYTGFQSIKLRRNSTLDTFDFLCDNWNQYFTITTFGGECPYSQKNETRQLVFTCNNYPEKLLLTLYTTGGGGVIEISFSGTTYTGGPVAIGKPYSFDSIQIVTKWYYGVEEITDNKLLTQLDYYCLYNVQYGILKLRLKNGEEWELLPN